MKFKDLTGKRYGNLVVIKLSDNRRDKHHGASWVCRCDCGNLIVVRADNLIGGHSTKCSDCNAYGGSKSVIYDGCDLDGTL